MNRETINPKLRAQADAMAAYMEAAFGPGDWFWKSVQFLMMTHAADYARAGMPLDEAPQDAPGA